MIDHEDVGPVGERHSHRQARGLWVPGALFLPPYSLLMAVSWTLVGYAAATIS